MKRKIVRIDEEKCTGCGLCVLACQEGALQIVNGKARLVSESYCDGLGACLPECPTGAITIEEREAAPFDEEAVKARSAPAAEETRAGEGEPNLACGCPGTQVRNLARTVDTAPVEDRRVPSALRNWPCQIRLVPAGAPYFDGAALLVAADCTAYAYPEFHRDFMRGRVTLIGCPKLDGVDYAEKLTEILKSNEIKSITVLRMEVPCCGGIVQAVRQALKQSGKTIPWRVVTITTEGEAWEE